MNILEDFLRVCEFFRSCVVCESLVGAERKRGGEGGQSCVNCVSEEGGRERERVYEWRKRKRYTARFL